MKTHFIESSKDFTGTLLVPVYETYEKNLIPIEFDSVSIPSKVFFGKKDTHYIIEKNHTTYIFIGLGKEPDYRKVNTIFRRIAAKQKDLFEAETAVVFPENFSAVQVEAAISGLLLGTYNLGHYKKTEKHPFTKDGFSLGVVSDGRHSESIEKGLKIAKAQLEVFYLVDSPPNLATPEFLSNWAKESGSKHGFTVEALDRKASQAIGLEAFVSVGIGSAQEPQFIIMNYVPENSSAKTKHVGFVGKGITFDTGGLNIKIAGMLHMKCDMAGGAAVLGAMQLIADLKLPVKVTAIVPACENSVDANSFLPSDVIGSYARHSIEIIDTDAEGRLILADGLSYLIKNYNPEIIVDVATLTGSAVATLGFECAALFTNNEQIAEQLKNSGDEIGERLWQLPLWDAYKSDIESDIADVKNYSGKPVAGAISAAKFLEYFTEDHKAWAHLDIAGVAFGDDEFAKSKHATAFGVHLLTKFIENL